MKRPPLSALAFLAMYGSYGALSEREAHQPFGGFGVPRRRSWEPAIAKCSFCGIPINNETERLPNPDTCMKSSCRAKWVEARKSLVSGSAGADGNVTRGSSPQGAEFDSPTRQEGQ